MQKIGIIGSGVVAKTLASGFLELGYLVCLGTRDESKLAEWKEKVNGRAKVGSFEAAATFGEMILLAVKGSAAKSALELAGYENLSGKTIIDATNPIAEGSPENGVLNFFTNLDESLMEQLQEAFPNSYFVKAFNSVGSAYMVKPQFPDGKPTMFICGNQEGAKKKVKEILDQFGWEIEDMGAATAARAIEPLCMLWCIPGFRENRWNHAFKLLKA